MSDAERQNEPIRTEAMKPEMERDDELMYGSEDNQDTPSKQQNFYVYEKSVNEGSIDYQNDETSPTDVTDGKKRDVEKIVPMTDGVKENDILLTNGQQNNENGAPFVHNTAAIVILPLPSRL